MCDHCVDELQERIEALEGEGKDLKATVENLDREKAELEGDVADLETQIEGVELDVTRLEDTVYDALANLRALPEVPLRDLEDSITSIVELLSEAL